MIVHLVWHKSQYSKRAFYAICKYCKHPALNITFAKGAGTRINI